MGTNEKEKFSRQIYPRLLKELRSLVGKVGRQMLSLAAAAIKDRLEKRHLRKRRGFARTFLENRVGHRPFSQKIAGFEKEIDAATDITKKYRDAFDDLTKL